MANRLQPDFIKLYTAMTKYRLNRLLATRIEMLKYKKEAGSKHYEYPTLGEIFTSERALAMLLRWHVKRPTDIVASKILFKRKYNDSESQIDYFAAWTEGSHLSKILIEADVKSWGPPSLWNRTYPESQRNEKEQQLINAIEKQIKTLAVSSRSVDYSPTTTYSTLQVAYWGSTFPESILPTEALKRSYAGDVDTDFTITLPEEERTLKSTANSFKLDAREI